MSGHVTDAERFSRQFTLEQLRDMSRLVEQGKLEEARGLLGTSEALTRDMQCAVHRALRISESSRRFMLQSTAFESIKLPTVRYK